MASPQKENGHVQIANELYDVILKCNFTARELKIILTVIRFTYGFNRKEARLSVRFISNYNRIMPHHVANSLNSLHNKNVLFFLGKTSENKGRILMLNKDYDTWVVKKPGSNCKSNCDQISNSDQKSNGTVTEREAETVTQKVTKKDKDKYNLNTIGIRKQNFINEVQNYNNRYTQNMLDAFMDYWIELNHSKTKMKFELEKTFDIGLRLKKWERTAIQWERNKGPGFYYGNNSNSDSFNPPELKLIYDRK